MRKQKLTYRFHDPNPPGVAAEYILKVCMEANMLKVEQAVREAMEAAERAEETAELDKPETLEWEEEPGTPESLDWETGEQEEIAETEMEECPFQDWTMTMV